MINFIDLLNWAATIFVWGLGAVIVLMAVFYVWVCLVVGVIRVGHALGLWRKDGMSHRRHAEMMRQAEEMQLKS
jgi:hypothetical protein